jgi:hypothetical protein
MLSHADRIKADLVRLQEKLDRCSDTSLRMLLEDWIVAKKKLLAQHLEAENKKSGGGGLEGNRGGFVTLRCQAEMSRLRLGWMFTPDMGAEGFQNFT